MSKASRLAAADTRILPPKDPATGRFTKRTEPGRVGPQLGLNSAGVSGGCGTAAPDAPFEVCGIRWEPIDCSPWHSPIGAALAVEMAGKP